jgi:putative heme-binding domain-containing protein
MKKRAYRGTAVNRVLLNNGKVVTGFVVKEAADKVTLRDAEAREIVILIARIEERSISPISMMPEGLVRDLTVGEFASLLGYLEALARKK